MRLNARADVPVATPEETRAGPAEGTTRTGALRVREFSARDVSKRLTQCDAVVEALSRQYRILDTLREAATQLVVHRPLPELFERLLDLLFAVVPAQRGAILLREDAPSRLEVKASRTRTGLPVVSVSRAIAARVMEEGKALLLDDALRDPAFSGAESIISFSVRSALCAPMWLANGEKDEVLGLVYLDSNSLAEAFDEDDLGLVTAIASVAAVKIHTTRLLDESRSNRRLQEEVRVAAEMQADLLPRTTPALAGWSLAGGSRPCLAMGGDYYDWELGPDGLRLILADVSGKGTAAALLMAAVRALVRSRWAEADLARASRMISRAVFDNVPASRYATAFLARLDPPTGRLRFVNAGHQPALIVRAGGAAQALASSGVPLGLMESASYTAAEATLDPGDTLLVFSDGVSEAGDATGTELGVDRLAEIVRGGRDLDAPALVRAIERALEEFSFGAAVEDDRTLLVLKRADPSPHTADRSPHPPDR